MSWRWFYAACFVAMMPVFLFSTRSFYGKYWFTLASRGYMTAREHEDRLEHSIRNDPSHGYSHLQMAKVLMSRKKYAMALEHQQAGMTSFRPVAAYEQMGTIQQRLGHASEAESYFNLALLMVPNNVQALEFLAYLAYVRGDVARLDQLLDDIMFYDMQNINALYLRALSAEKKGSLQAEYINLQKVSAELARKEKLPAGLFFDRAELGRRLNDLKPFREQQ